MVDLRSGKFPDVKRELDDMRSAKNICVPYSATHVDELQGIHRVSDSDEIRRRLNWVREFTGGHYLYLGFDVEVPEFRQFDPARVLATLNEVPRARSAMRDLATLLSASLVQDFRHAVGLDPNEINNIRPPRVLEQIEALLRAGLQKQPHSEIPNSLREMIQLAASYHRDGARFGWSEQVAGIMTLLNWVGLRADHDFTGQGWGSSFNDGEHVALAAYTDLFVTGDKRLRIKAQAVYEYNDIGIEVLAPEEIVGWLSREG